MGIQHSIERETSGGRDVPRYVVTYAEFSARSYSSEEDACILLACQFASSDTGAHDAHACAMLREVNRLRASRRVSA